MNRFWPVHAAGVLCALLLPALAGAQTKAMVASAALDPDKPARIPEAVIAYLPDDPDVPPDLMNLMRNAQLKYLEGSKLIKSGESDRARAAFNKAVDLLLESDYSLNSNIEFNQFFQDLIRRIQQDESKYLRPPDLDEKPESAVVDELEKVDLIPITVDPDLQDVVEADLANTRYDIPVTLNERVLKSLNFWLNKGRKYFVSGLMRSGRYKDMIERIFREQSVPLDLMYLAQVESLFKTNALSRAMAKGIWQFGKGTAVRYGLKVNSYIDERSDPEKSTVAAARYLNDLYAMFKDWNLVLAAYNWGEGKVLKLMDRSGINDFWELMELRRNFPAETQNHVPLIMASIILARNPDKYGLPGDLESALEVSKIQVGKPIDLRAAARILNISLEELKQLNPALRGLSTPPGYPEFQLNIPAQSTADMQQKVAVLPEVRIRLQTDLATTRYKIQAGDTLDHLARKYGTSVAALKSANRITSPNQLKAGSWIRVPTRSTSASSRLKSATLKPSTRSKTPLPKAPVARKPAAKTPVKSGSLSPSKNPIPKAPAKSSKPAASTKKPVAKEIASR
jgi:membrane-bound lytic murein transglycosylase D